MTSRERTLAVLLGCLIGVFVLGGAGYLGVYLPIADRAAEVRKLEDDIAAKQDRLLVIQKNRPRLEATLRRSLPADPKVASQEYGAALTKILRDARVPASAYSVKARPADGRAAPELDPKTKKPAYTRVVFEVTLKRVTFATLIDFLERYYRLNLLQQITKFTVKRVDEGGSSSTRTRGGFGGGSAGSSLLADKADLEVLLLTEAVILDGAENRKSLLPVPVGFGAAGGGAGLATVQQSPEPARGLNPIELTQVLAHPDREYRSMLVKDIFHGPMREAPKEEIRVEEPKEDTSPFIRLTGVGRNPDGTGVAFIEDVASNQDYAVELSRVKGKLTPQVVKYYYTIKGQRKSYAPEPDLEIADATSSTYRKFRVVGISPDGDALVLTALDGDKAPTAPAFQPKGGQGFQPGGFPRKGGGNSPSRPSTPPGAAVAGGVVAGLPSEKVYVWKAGEPLSKVQLLSPTEGAKAVALALGLLDETKTVPASATAPADDQSVAEDRED